MEPNDSRTLKDIFGVKNYPVGLQGEKRVRRARSTLLVFILLWRDVFFGVPGQSKKSAKDVKSDY